MKRQLSLPLAGACAAGALSTLVACGGGDLDINTKPAFVGEVRTTAYDGQSDDLLTAGLGADGLVGAVPPAIANPQQPTAQELRRLAIYNNYRALVDMTAAGGYGRFYGPQVASDGTPTGGDGKVAGTEHIAYSDNGSGRRNVTLMVQVPASFDPDAPCIVTATSSGSRGVYGAISTGEWGLKRGCTVAYNDKGTGAAPHDLATDTVPLIDGTRTTAAAAGADAAFRAPLSAAELVALNAATPNRLAFKHAHSGQNPEKDWGDATLQSVAFAFWVLNESYGRPWVDGQRVQRLRPDNTLVIASSISNGGGAALAAAERDTAGWIDGVAVAEPAVQMPNVTSIQVERGGVAVPLAGRTLYDYTSQANLYQSCASLSAQVAGAPGNYVVGAFAVNRCASLRAKGLLTADTTAAQADESLQRLRDYGWEPEAAILHASHAAFEIAPAVTLTFGSALARARVQDNLCGYSFAAATPLGIVTTVDSVQLAQMFATGNGVPPQAVPNVQLINNLSPGGPLRDLLSISPSTGLQDFNLDGALCLRNLLDGSNAAALALQTGVDETRRSGNLNGKPAIIVHGRDDALLPVNHTSRPYTALNKRVEGANSRLSYVEVTNAQHFDGFIGLPTILPGYDTRYVPLHLYLFRALDAMWAHLNEGTPLPPSQVLRTLPRGGTPGAAPALSAANVPVIAAVPAAGDAITMSGTTLRVPD
jgi:hydroxybutyrate-dimer hydrolase